MTKPSRGRAAAHVGVAGGQELLSRHRAEQAAERAGQQQRPGPGVDALAGHVDQRDLERLAVEGGHHEIAAERGTAGRPEHHRRAPALAQPGQLALGLDAVPQLEQHPVAAQALDAELLAGPGQDVGEDRGQHDGGHDARARPCPSPGRRSRRPRRRRRRCAAPGATSAGRRPGSARSSRRARTTTPRRARRPPRWRSPRADAMNAIRRFPVMNCLVSWTRAAAGTPNDPPRAAAALDSGGLTMMPRTVADERSRQPKPFAPAAPAGEVRRQV